MVRAAVKFRSGATRPMELAQGPERRCGRRSPVPGGNSANKKGGSVSRAALSQPSNQTANRKANTTMIRLHGGGPNTIRGDAGNRPGELPGNKRAAHLRLVGIALAAPALDAFCRAGRRNNRVRWRLRCQAAWVTTPHGPGYLLPRRRPCWATSRNPGKRASASRPSNWS